MPSISGVPARPFSDYSSGQFLSSSRTPASTGRAVAVVGSEDPMLASWMKLATDMSMLALESSSVITSRVVMMATGRGTSAENTRMISEKFLAATEAAVTLANGGSAAKVVHGYRKRVRANVRRLKR